MRRIQKISSLFVTLSFTLSVSVHAADVYKADNATSLGQAGSFVTLLPDGTYTPATAAPGANDTLIFDNYFTTTSGSNSGGLRNYYGIKVVNSGGLGTTEQTGTVLISNGNASNTIQLGAGGIDMSTAVRSLTIYGVTVNASQTWNIASGLTLTVGQTRFSNPLLNPDADFKLDVVGSGQLTLNGTNAANISLPGGIALTGVRLNSTNINNAGGASTPLTIHATGQAYLTGTNSAGYANNFSIAGTGWGSDTIQTGALRLGNNATVSGNVTLTDDASITAYNSSGTISGVISDSEGDKVLTIGATGDTGVVNFSGVNTYTGPTFINGGTLAITRTGSISSHVTVSSTTTLDVLGTITGNVDALSGSTVHIGRSNATGLANIQGELNLANNSSIHFDIAGINRGAELNGYDAINALQSLDLNGTIYINLTSTEGLAVDQVFNLIDWSYLNASNVVSSEGYSFDFTGTDVESLGLKWNTDLFLTTGNIYLTAVPEPTRAILLALAGTILLIRRRRTTS